jgi:hypothetical protein
MSNPRDRYEWPAAAAHPSQYGHFDEPHGAVETAAAEPDDPPLDEENPWPQGFAEWFALGLTLLPALLFLPGSQAYRLPIRVGAYGISLYAFATWLFNRGGRREGKHPAERYLVLALVVLALGLAHPLTSSLESGLAQIGLYFAILCPIYWARTYVTTRRQLVRIVLLLLVCNGINSIVGVLQVYNPDRWMPRELSNIYQGNTDILMAASYVGPGGRLIVRPPGLFDTPGAVCSAGTIAALFGLILALEPLAAWKRGVALTMAIAGISAIYLSHVRVSFVVTLGMMVTYVAMLSAQKQTKRVAGFTALAVGLVLGGLSLATVLGGQSISERFSTLVAEDPRELYYRSRGQSVEYAFNNLIAEYPLGAGLARWGMMSFYFGGPRNADVPSVFAEVQPNAWLLDGGIFLMLFYGLALTMSAIHDIKLVRSLANRDDRLWSAAVIAANFGTLALVFSFVPFGTAAGMQFWFLEGALHGAMASRPRIQA